MIEEHAFDRLEKMNVGRDRLWRAARGNAAVGGLPRSNQRAAERDRVVALSLLLGSVLA